MTPEMAAALAAPFPPEAVGIRPEIVCPLCKLGRACGEHKRAECPECGQTITTAHIHLDYVGHAWVRERLTQVDPEWTWEPMAFDERGLPAYDAAGGLWIWLTVGGKRLPGYGDAPGKHGGNAVKEAIGDALRNGGQSFGVALDMWKRERPAPTDAPPVSMPEGVHLSPEGHALFGTAQRDQDNDAGEEAEQETAVELRGRIREIDKVRGRRAAQTAADFTKWSRNNVQFIRASPTLLAEYLAHLTQQGKRR